MTTPPTSAGRFAPGEIVAERYRIVALLGRGGMGEVYRADDLKLGVAVAIKFLPEALESDADLRQRFLSEVRLARQVAHPNVCRTFDLGDIGGRYYLTMEYVDGEDLASLLRRVGRMAGDRAIEVARQIAAGLAAAHEQGILHRDLKPANVLIDGRGRARLTDFGLAGFADGEGARGGTPAYMAPEQLAGGDASVKSDLYALGLIYYELFTGRPAFDPSTPVGMLARERQHSTPVTPASLVSDLPPAVERVIQRCLAAEPTQRPTSAFAVAAALPGGDPLAAAIAAGETPSPELLAEAGSSEGLSRRGAWIAFAAFAVALIAAVGLAPQTQLMLRAAPAKPTEVLRERATNIAARFGWTGPFADRDGAWTQDGSVIRWIAKTDSTPGRWKRLAGRDGQWLVFYWWRQSPRPLEPVNLVRAVSAPFDPALELPGDVLVLVDGAGRLRRLLGVPDDHEDSLATRPPVAWGALLAEAGLDSTAFRPITPTWTPPEYADERRAWAGHDTTSGLDLRVEAAAHRGRVVSFRIARPWTEYFTPTRPANSPWQRPVQLLVLLLVGGLVGTGVVLAVRNLRDGSAHHRGALRVAQGFFVTATISVLVTRHHMPVDAGLVDRLIVLLGPVISVSLLFATFYLALEPNLRRLFPDLFVSWVRALELKFSDARVARDLLVGLIAGVALMALQRALVAGSVALHVPLSTPDPAYSLATEAFAANGWKALVAQLCDAMGSALQFTLVLMLITLLASIRIRSRVVTIGIVVVSMLIVRGAQGVGSPFEAAYVLTLVLLIIVALFRLGPFATLVLLASNELLRTIPTPLDSSAWFFRGTPFVVLALTLPALYALRASLAAHEPARRLVAGPPAGYTPRPTAPTAPPARTFTPDTPTMPYTGGASHSTTPDSPTEYTPRPSDRG